MAKQVECTRCDGHGVIRGYSHVREGVCFKCGGSGKMNAPRNRKPAAEKPLSETALQHQRDYEAAQVDPRVNNSPLIVGREDHPNIKGLRLEAYRYHQKWGWPAEK